MQIGLVGLPGSGKTTLFNALVKANAETGGFSGINKANRGTIKVPDQRVNRLSGLFDPQKTTFATVEYLDIGGITSGTGKQEDQQDSGGLNDLRNMDVLVHVLRGFQDLAGAPVTPGEDYESVVLELAIADLEIIERRLGRLSREARSTKRPDLVREWKLLEQCKEEIEGGGVIRNLEFVPEDEKRLRGYQFLSQKPVLLVLNIPEEDLTREAQILAALGDYTDQLDTLALCAKVEMEIAQLDEDDAGAFLEDLGIKESALNRMIISSYRLLNLISFFTVGEDEVKAWDRHAGRHGAGSGRGDSLRSGAGIHSGRNAGMANAARSWGMAGGERARRAARRRQTVRRHGR